MGTKPPSTHWGHHFTRVGMVALITPDHHRGKVSATGTDAYSVEGYTGAALFEVFLYGVYVTLFAVCIMILLRGKRISKFLLTCAMIMFAIATVDVALELSFLFCFVLKKSDIPDSYLHLKFLIFTTSNVIADSLVIYRCYLVWSSKKVTILPIILLAVGSACGYAYVAVSDDDRFRSLLVAFLVTTIVLNVLVTILLAGRIWWIARKARTILGPSLSSKYKTIAAIILESGVLYSIYVVLDVVVPNLLLDSGLAQVVGIVPTLIIVRIGLGQSARGEDSSSMVQTEAHGFATMREDMSSEPTQTRTISSIPSPAIPPLVFSTQRTN